jgi:hypothetical protein
MYFSPFEQFEIQVLFSGLFMNVDLSITNLIIDSISLFIVLVFFGLFTSNFFRIFRKSRAYPLAYLSASGISPQSPDAPDSRTVWESVVSFPSEHPVWTVIIVTGVGLLVLGYFRPDILGVSASVAAAASSTDDDNKKDKIVANLNATDDDESIDAAPDISIKSPEINAVPIHEFIEPMALPIRTLEQVLAATMQSNPQYLQIPNATTYMEYCW